jgi:hypothetical protein
VRTHDLNVRGVLLGALIVAVGIAASVAGAWLLAARSGASPSGPNAAARPAWTRNAGEPALQTVPHEDLQSYLREKRAWLESSGPIEGEPGRMHIPIEQAMQRLAQSNRR